VQYIAVQAGYGGSGISFPIPPSSAAYRNMNTNRILVFKLGGGAVTPPEPRVNPFDYPEPPKFTATAAQIAHGEEKFTEYCSRCHGFGPGVTPDLSRLPPEVHAMFADIVLKGALAPLGMAPLNDLVSKDDVEAIHAYLLDQEKPGYEAQHKKTAGN
jgi:quinohemoprotein ethanol dehydrogenase